MVSLGETTGRPTRSAQLVKMSQQLRKNPRGMSTRTGPLEMSLREMVQPETAQRATMPDVKNQPWSSCGQRGPMQHARMTQQQKMTARQRTPRPESAA